MQVGRVAATVAAVAAVVSGCGGGPGQAGSAVIVGTNAVPLESVQSELAMALSDTEQLEQFEAQGGTAADIARSIVTSEVLHGLLSQRAATDGIVISDAQIDAVLEANDGAEAARDMPSLRERVHDSLIAAQIGQRLAPGLAVTADLAGAASRDDAERIARTLAAGGPAADALLDDARVPAARGRIFQAATSPNEAGEVVFGVPVGATGFFQPDPDQSSWVVFRVVDRRTDMPSDPAAISSISQSQLANIGVRAVQLDGEAQGIRVNPRYGEWDPVQLRVVGEGQQAGGIILPAAPPAG